MYIAFLADVARDPATPTTTRSGTRPRPGRVLLVDDDVLLLRALARWLARTCEVTIAPSGALALEELAKGRPFDVIFSDVCMPEIDGRELYLRIAKRHPAMRDRIVFVSGGLPDGILPRFVATIPNLLVPKPVDIALLDAIVADAVVGILPAERKRKSG